VAHLLIVDDEEPMRKVLKAFLRGSGYTAEYASDVASAQQMLQTSPFDVVVSDIHLPGLSGVELLRSVRAAAPRTQVILITGAASLATATEAVRAGAFDYLCKPFAPDTLLRSIALAVRVKTIEDERQKVIAQLEHARQEEDENERARQAQLRLKDELVSHVSHELLTPLTAVHQFISLVNDGLAGEINAEQCEYLNVALKNVRQLQAMISDLLDVSRTQKDLLQIHPRPFCLVEALKAALIALKQEALRKKQALTLETEPDLPHILADPLRVQQILANLIGNAIKFTPEGGAIRVRAARRRERDAAPEEICISVADTGCGIRPEHQARIFDQFYQVNPNGDDRRGGLGLGLYICRNLVTRQNGRLWVESQPGEGSTFAFTLPACPPETTRAGS
jgi:signal transduction histidine kinase